MNAPQIVVICLLVGQFVFIATNHGKPKRQATDHVGRELVGSAMFVLVLWWGGFWQ